MELPSLVTFALMVSLLTVIPGPNTALILKTVPQNGRSAGVLNLAGIVSGFFMHGMFSILGLSALILRSSQAFLILKLLGSFYLLYLGATSLWHAVFSKHPSVKTKIQAPPKDAARSGRRLFLEGFLTNLLNPKASMFYLAIFPQFINIHGNPALESLLLVGVHSVVVITWFSFFIFTIDKVSRALSSDKFKRTVQGATGLLMLWFGYRLLVFQQKSS